MFFELHPSIERPIERRPGRLELLEHRRDLFERLRVEVGRGRARFERYTPPEGESTIRELMAGWERFIHQKEGPDPLIRMAAGHYQFEAIHPFTDGNGRTGRILNSLFLIQEDLLTLPILYLSRYIIRHKEDYYGLLIDVTRNEAYLCRQMSLRVVSRFGSWFNPHGVFRTKTDC